MGFYWNLDQRSQVAREVAVALGQLMQDLGGQDNLSSQQRMLCERAVFLHRRLISHESAVLSGQEPVMSVNEHVGATNALVGLLKNLGLKRQSRDVGSLQAYLAEADEEGSDATDDAA